MRTHLANHIYGIGETVSLNFYQGEFLAKLNHFTVEAQMPTVGSSLQYRIKSDAETCRRVVAEHQLSAFGSQATASPDMVTSAHSGEED